MTLIYDPAGSTCSGKIQSGTRALRDALLPRFPPLFDKGIYNCRPVSGGTRPSVHGEGRAWDAGVPTACHPQGDALAVFLVRYAEVLGIQQIIWCRREWGGRDLDFYWKSFDGASGSHTDHLHIEQNWAKATTLTKAQIDKLFVEPVPEPIPVPVPLRRRLPMIVNERATTNQPAVFAEAFEASGKYGVGLSLKDEGGQNASGKIYIVRDGGTGTNFDYTIAAYQRVWFPLKSFLQGIGCSVAVHVSVGGPVYCALRHEPL